MEYALALEYSNISGIRCLSLGVNRYDSALQDRPLEGGHLVLRCISSDIINLSAAPRQAPAGQFKRGASSSQWSGTDLARNKRPSPPARSQFARAEKEPPAHSSLLLQVDGTQSLIATQYLIDSSFQLTRFCWTCLFPLRVSPSHPVVVTPQAW